MRFLHLISLIFVSVWLVAGPVRAETLQLRSAEHAEYTRLVFEWDKPVGYSVSRKDQGKLVLAFDKGAKVENPKALLKSGSTVSSIKVLSSDPLELSLAVPPESRVRDLKAGRKIVVDVYRPEGAAKPLRKKAAATKPVAKPNAKVKSTSKAEKQAGPGEETLGQKAKTVVKQVVKKLRMREDPTLITVSSTENFGMAFFELAGRLWMVNDTSDLLIKPQTTGPMAEVFNAFDEVEGARGGVAHVLEVSEVMAGEGAKLKGVGGGVLWRAMIGRDVDVSDVEPADPVRMGVRSDAARAGTLVWPLDGVRTVLQFDDPHTGRSVLVVTVEGAGALAGKARNFIDFDVLPSFVGLAIVPKVDDLQVQIVRGGVEISRPGGLSMVEEGVVASVLEAGVSGRTDPERAGKRIFDFQEWRLGGPSQTFENKRIILGGLRARSETVRSEDVLTLAKMYLSNAMGAEALGMMNYALMDRAELIDAPEFSALYGVASALINHNEAAYKYLFMDLLEPFNEIRFWQAYVLAHEGDWQQAASVLPKYLDVVFEYPELLQNRLIPVLAEITLRNGDLERADILLKIVEKNKASMEPPQRAALRYLEGEAARQRGDIDGAKDIWGPLAEGRDDLYRAKAGLALTRLKVEDGEIDLEDSLSDLERLRYAWRGDQLEVQINYWLGKTYFETGKYLKGLKMLRDAVSYDSGTILGPRITAEMAEMFTELFLGPKLDDVSPLDALSLYDEFKELVPLNERGDRIIERTAENLATADLLGRAADLLKYQLDHRLKGEDAYRIGVRVAALRLLDKRPGAALEALDIAAKQLQKAPEELQTPARAKAILMLRARAMSQQGRSDQALEMLRDLDLDADMNRLRADIAWGAGYWDDAAEALGDVIADQDFSMTRPLDKDEATLLLQRAIALSLSGDRIALANMREKYNDLMAQTPKANVFELITRPRQSGLLADRETLLSAVSEVDLFKEFLDSYRLSEPPVN